MNKLKKSLCSLGAAFLLSASMISAVNASAKQELIGYRGDVNADMKVSVADLVQLSGYIQGKTEINSENLIFTDVNADNYTDSLDLASLRIILSNNLTPDGIFTEIPDSDNFINPPIKYLDGNLPSQGDAKLVIFCVDFPDCKFKNNLSADYIQNIAFGAEDASNPNYPFESMTAFYERGSKNTMHLSGQVFRYTAQNSKSVYDNDKNKLTRECYEAFNSEVDFSAFDGDSDGKIDATLIVVPEAAGDDYWWAAAGPSSDYSYSVDGKRIGHLIAGNTEPESLTDYTYFNSTYLHEMGHCMGLPDYYLYYTEDYNAMHGTAGCELMDADASTDFSAFSKLMLGWFRENQIQIYDSSAGTQEFTLNNAQTNYGNCVIIPCGTLDENYFSEYFIIEYITPQYNNSNPAWWQTVGDGIRIHHIRADVKLDYWWPIFVYETASEFNGGDDLGIRLIRVVNDFDGDNCFHVGDVIDNSIQGFGWYDEYENESVDPGVKIEVTSQTSNSYSIKISAK